MASAHTLTSILFFPFFAVFSHSSHHPSTRLLCVSFSPLIASATDDSSASENLNAGFSGSDRQVFFFLVWGAQTEKETRVRWSDEGMGGRMGGRNSTETTEPLDSLSLDTHTQTHTNSPSRDSNLRAIFRPDDWQLDAHSSPTRPSDNSSYPHSTAPYCRFSPLFSHIATFFFIFDSWNTPLP